MLRAVLPPTQNEACQDASTTTWLGCNADAFYATKHFISATAALERWRTAMGCPSRASAGVHPWSKICMILSELFFKAD